MQALKESDKVARVNFAQHMLDEISRCPDFLDRIIFSDEAIFHLEGGVNTHNCTNWSKTNPHWTIEKSLNSPKVMVWAAIGTSGIIGPIFFQENVGGESYLKLLMEDFFPAFCNLPKAGFTRCDKLLQLIVVKRLLQLIVTCGQEIAAIYRGCGWLG